MQLIAFAVLVLGPLNTSIPEPVQCSVRGLRENPGYRYRVDQIEQFVNRATVIVRAVAVGTDTLVVSAPATAERAETTYRLPAVRFDVTETLRGAVPDGQLILQGTPVENDDFNALPVPYTMVRPAGQRGDCFASEYRVGAEYLLLLQENLYGLTARWWPLAPANEQLRGADDPWLQWVRDHIARSESDGAGI